MLILQNLRKALYPCAVFFLLLIWCLRTTGIHIDENNYLKLALTHPTGDFFSSGKPALFYFLNYIATHTLGWILPLPQSYVLYFFYILLTVFSVWRFVRIVKLPAIGPFLFTSPLLFFNSSHLMMETLVLPFLTLSVCEWTLYIEQKKQNILLRAVFLTAITFLAKETSIGGIFLILFTLLPVKEKESRKILSIAFIVLICLYSLHKCFALTFAKEVIDYGGPLKILNWKHFSERFSSIFTYLGVCIYFWGTLLSLKLVKQNFKLFLSTLFIVFIFQMMSLEDFARYIYPTLWASILLVSKTEIFKSQVKKTSFWILHLLLAGIFIAALCTKYENRMQLIPDVISKELYYSGYTVFPGMRMHAWVLLSRKDNLCILLPLQYSEKPFAMKNYLLTITQTPRFFNETEVAQFEACMGKKAILRRQYQINPQDCSPECSKETFSLVECVVQNMKGWAAFTDKPLTNRICLP